VTWIDDYFEAAALDRFAHIARVTDALDATKPDKGAEKNRVGEFEQGKQTHGQGNGSQQIRQNGHHSHYQTNAGAQC
jgi:hypothetical protein